MTRPLVQERPAGPGFRELARLAKGELRALPFAEHYRLEQRLGQGGMAVVFRGEHLGRGQGVAVKILREQSGDRYQMLASFLREGRLAAHVHHQNIVEMLDFGSTPEGVVYLVMELLQGEDLRGLIARHEGLPWSRVRSLMLQICDGLVAVHEAGIVHGDLTPSNCFRTLDGDHEQIKLLDFGAATMVGAEEDRLDHDDDHEGTRTVVGTPQYMSPEQARGEAVDARSDVYAAGIVLCELLTGKVPFRGAPVEVLAAHVHDQPPTLQQLAPAGMRINPAIERIFAKAVAKAPEDRFSCIEEMAAAIRGVGSREPIEISGAFTPVSVEPVEDDADEPAKRGPWQSLTTALRAALGGLGSLRRRLH